jgi:hypothetical protein
VWEGWGGTHTISMRTIYMSSQQSETNTDLTVQYPTPFALDVYGIILDFAKLGRMHDIAYLTNNMRYASDPSHSQGLAHMASPLVSYGDVNEEYGIRKYPLLYNNLQDFFRSCDGSGWTSA